MKSGSSCKLRNGNSVRLNDLTKVTEARLKPRLSSVLHASFYYRGHVSPALFPPIPPPSPQTLLWKRLTRFPVFTDSVKKVDRAKEPPPGGEHQNSDSARLSPSDLEQISSPGQPQPPHL